MDTFINQENFNQNLPEEVATFSENKTTTTNQGQSQVTSSFDVIQSSSESFGGIR